MSNTLGKVIRYVAEAVDYGAAPFRRGQKSGNMWGAALTSMAKNPRITRDTLNVDESLRLAVTSAWAYAAIRLKADRIGRSDARPIAKRREKEKLVDIHFHPFEQLLLRPNSIMTADFIFSYTTWWADLLGNAYIFVSTQAPGVGIPEELWPIPANMVKPKPETLRRSRLTGGQCIDYEYVVGGKTFIVPGENMIHIRYPNPFDYWNGLSPLSAALMGIKIDHGEQRFIHAHYTEDNAVPPSIISLPAETNQQDFEIIAESIREQFAGRRRTAITRAGDISVQLIQQTLEQMQHIETRKFNREEINVIFGVPEGMLTGGVSGDSRLATEIAFARNTVQPLLDRIAAEMTANLAPYYGPDIEIAAPSIIPQDRALRIQEFATYSRSRTINENREWLNLPPIDPYEVLEKINKKREKMGLEPFELSDPAIQMMMDLPIELHPFITSSTFSSSKPPMFANVPAPPEVGDLPGMFGPDNFTEDQAVRTAVALAYSTELKRWEKVATKEAREGRNPAEREFTSSVLPNDLIISVSRHINHATEDEVRKVFARELQWVESSS